MKKIAEVNVCLIIMYMLLSFFIAQVISLNPKPLYSCHLPEHQIVILDRNSPVPCLEVQFVGLSV